MEIRQLDAELLEWLGGSDLESKQHEAMQLLTVTGGQWPHLAMISMGEVIAISPDCLRLALWQGTQTSMNMMETGKATLIAVHGQRILHIRLEVRLLPELGDTIHPRDRYECNILHIRIDQAPYAEITSGITFQLKDQTGALARWNATIEDLRK
ncbi:pyridoxamine 5'-phosphate oxidase family protein [Paenibacillus polysaccharolyticus]|uniref:pyridoxamine 5'-phosphate oxidase family protein n=1 Tax=Paenibacillus polysaccharolyticus TaxID=582692 RepID=UPI0012B8DF27|nr:pyridoxamine 5'-phosphate oxidase family protein [Paenibacillus polysaccharolyticus]MCP1134713.1 pyridoxamine 5'-phosphate oxidase family protein [Paenibacillus polysaccharolyticus]